MSVEPLGLDIPPLTRVTMDALTAPQPTAINCSDALPQTVADYVRGSLADNTRQAYRSDLAHFEHWGGTMPATDQLIASYLAAHAETHSVASLTRRLASLSVREPTSRSRPETSCL